MPSYTLPANLLTLPNADKLSLSIRAKALIFSDPDSQAILDRIDRIAPSEATVLVIGETGTGKELVARRIHEKSGRAGPFMAINCGAFTENLIEAELFGHEAGAFTGAQQARPGWFEAADGGTLFLDEIGDLPLPLQVKLLRVLQERQVVRLGSRKPIPLDVRLIAATNVRLERAVESGRFRADLYYRLNVASLQLPSLRERPGDIFPLAAYFTDLYSRRLGLGDVEISPAAKQALLGYPWPGNIRELENVIHFALILGDGQTIEFDDLRLPGLTMSSGGSSESEKLDPVTALTRAIRKLLESDVAEVAETVERVLTETAFAYADNNQVRTARRLGVSRNIVRAQLRRFGLLGEREPEQELSEA